MQPVASTQLSTAVGTHRTTSVLSPACPAAQPPTRTCHPPSGPGAESGTPRLCIPGNIVGRAGRESRIIYSCQSSPRELVWRGWQAAGCAAQSQGTGMRGWRLTRLFLPAPVPGHAGWLHSGKSRDTHCLSHLSKALGSCPQHLLAQLPSEPGKSPLLLSWPLAPEICSLSHHLCFPDQFAAFHIDCCLFSHSACWWIWGFYC